MKTWLLKQWWRLVRLGFRLLYNEMAWTYEGVSWVVSLGKWRTWQRTALKHLPPPTAFVLELAHGTGNLQLDLHAAGYQCAGLDLSRTMGIIARRKLKRNHIVAPLVRGAGQALPLANASFDAVVSTFPTPFIFDHETLHEIYRVLKPNGRLVIVINGLLTSNNIASKSLEWAYRITGQRDQGQLTLDDIFANTGFSVQFISEPCPRSIAQLIIADKSVENRP